VSTSAAGVQGTSSVSSISTGGVVGINNAGSGSVGVLGQTASGYGVRGVASASGGYGVAGVATDSYGVYGTSTSGTGVRGDAAGSTGYGVLGQGSSGAAGVHGRASGGGRAGYFTQTSTSSTAPAVEITQAGTGPALKLTGAVNTNTTGPASMLPVAYGCISSTGSKLSGTSNWTVTQLSQGYYRITFTSPDLATQSLLDNPVQVTPQGFFWSGNPIVWSAYVASYVYPGGTANTTPAGSIDVVVTWAFGGMVTQGTDNNGIPPRLYQLFNFSFMLYNP
jgi:hypothetical protein